MYTILAFLIAIVADKYLFDDRSDNVTRYCIYLILDILITLTWKSYRMHQLLS